MCSMRPDEPEASHNAGNHSIEEDNISDNDETINVDDPFLFNAENEQNFERNETDINEVDWTQAQGITPDSSLAWALDGHIRLRNPVSSGLLPPTGLVRNLEDIIPYVNKFVVFVFYLFRVSRHSYRK